MLLFFMFISFLLKTSAKLTMIIVWGQPDSLNQCNNSGFIGFMNCSSLCMSQNSCVVAFGSTNQSSTCYLCGFQAVKSVVQKTYTDNMKVGMKINTSETTCPAQYPVERQIDNGYSELIDQQVYTYGIGFSNGKWAFQYEISSCPTGWQFFMRQMGPWCIKVKYDPITFYNWTNANSQCQSQGAVLSGMENRAEHDYIYSTGAANWTTGFGFLWIGAQRVPECTYPAWNATICSNKSTVFEWTDGFTTGTEGFNYWGPNSPDGYNVTATGKDTSDSCLQMWMNNGNSSGLVDDASCNFTSIISSSNIWCASAYVCGKKPVQTFY